ncbi:hypothetical protein ACJJIF_02975 [Microbulbifer sp. SSSA002]|uniref:hypothetical protein n=1 Tax=unclassified Microbulbifer TaxID=2619833 RepID=UPI004039B2F8
MDIEFGGEILDCYGNSSIISIHPNGSKKDILHPGIVVTIRECNSIKTTLKIAGTDKDYFLYNNYALWHSWIVIGCGGHAHFISKDFKKIKSLSLGATSFGYFQEFLTSEDYPLGLEKNHLLITSGTGLTLIDDNADIVWQLDHLAVDGTNVQDISGNTIYGSAEVDPPGGWLDFQVSLADGALIKAPKY